MLSVSKNGEKTREYVYNKINSLMSSTVDGVTTTYAYNGDRLRESKTTNGVTTRHIYDGTDVVADVTGDTTTNFVRGIGLIYSENMTTGDKRKYALNAHGDVAKHINADGTAEKFNYRAYGIGIVGTPDPFGYCGEYTDSETGLIYLRNRYYDPELGRFINVDPIFSGANWYAYCSGNPVNRVDPFGLEYGKLRDFVNDYMVAFNGGVSIAQSSLNGKGFAGVTMGKYFRAFYYDGTIINREYDTYSGELTSEKSVKIADNIDGTLYMQRSAFVAAMGMVDDGTAQVKTTDEFYVSDLVAMADFATYINGSVSAANDVKDVYDIFGKAPTVGKVIRNFAAVRNIGQSIKNGEILSTGNYRSESVTVKRSGYKHVTATMYGTENRTKYYQFFVKFPSWHGIPSAPEYK